MIFFLSFTSAPSYINRSNYMNESKVVMLWIKSYVIWHLPNEENDFCEYDWVWMHGLSCANFVLMKQAKLNKSKQSSRNKNNSFSCCFHLYFIVSHIYWLHHMTKNKHIKINLTLPMLKQLSSKAQKCKNLWKMSKPCHVGIHWIDLDEYSQMSTHFSRFP